ncbi:hypothetical protein HZC31_06440 [Candidatus Woesearchaeota archaeon]|nr:hypothetical protein [Candidatus Woesearchaeota archaeon]
MTNKGMTSSSSTFQRLFILFTLLTITLLSTLPLLSGKETVSFQTTGATVAAYSAAAFGSADNSVCAGAATVQQLVLRNQGTVADTYYISASSDDAAVASWLSIGQQGTTLQPGEESTVVYYITPDTDVAGTFDYTLTITSLYSDTKVIEQTITVGECPNIALNAYTTSQQTCPCSVGIYVFDLANSGSSTETYSLWLADMDPAYYDLSEYQVTLAPGEHQDIYAYLRMACSIYGEFSFTLVAETSQSGYTAELPLALDVQQACYVYNIALGEALIFSSDAPMIVTFTPKADTTYVLCQEDPAVIPVNIQNSGDISNEYHVFIEDAEDWITAAEPYIKLKGDQEHTTSLVVNSVAAPVGTYSFALKAETLRGDLESVLPFTVEIQQCAPDEGLPALLKWTLITLLGAVLLAILIVGYFLYTKKGQKGKGGKEHPLMTWAGKHKHLLWALLGLFLLLLLIGILAYPIVKEKYDARVAAGSDSAEEARTLPTLFYNWATALIALGILLLLAFLVWHFKLRKKQKKSTGKTKGKKESNIAGFWNKFWNATTWQKIKPFLKWLWIIFLLLLLLGGLTAGMYFLYNNYKEDASKFLTQQNATAEQETEEIAVEETETSETAALEEQIKLLQEQIASLEEKLLAMSEAVAQDDSDDQQKLLDQIAALEEQISALEKQLQDLLDKQTEPTEEDDDTKALEERIDALEEQIKALQALIATLSLEQNQETQEVVESIEEEIDSLEEEKEQLEEQQEEEIVVPEITSSTFKTILAFDVSLSGQIVENGKTRFERGIIAAQTYIQEKGIYSVMIVGKNPIVIRRNVDSETALKVIKNLRPLDTQSNLGKALYYAAEQLNGEEGRIVLISDMQTTDNTDIYDIKKELEEQGIDVVFLSLSQKKSVVQPVETSDEETAEEQEPAPEEVAEETVQESPVFDTESQTAGDFVITLPKNSVYSLDLEHYFSDADDDALVYTATAGEHLTALVEGAIALLTPEQNWIGETTIRFAADDEKGGAVESPLFKVIVAEQETAIVAEEAVEEEVIPEEEQNIAEQEEAIEEEPAQENAVEETEGTTETNSYVPWIILGSIIFLIILSLVMGAFVKKFHNDPNTPENKDHEKKE